ncbi:MAG: DUF47 family protein [Candidatus Paceibacterota bacterium]|jgi:hypothetical protein
MINLFPKDEIFYNLFEQQAAKLKEAAKILDQILANPENIKEYAAQMKKIEVEMDSIGYSVLDNLRKSLITPLEGEDIELLRQDLDSIMDCIEKATNRILIYQIAIPYPQAIREYIGIIKKAIEEIGFAVKEIRNVHKFHDLLYGRCQKINRLENEGDEVNRRALKNLMGIDNPTPQKILEVVKFKEIYETLESAIDFCEDVGNIFEIILIKNR